MEYKVDNNLIYTLDTIGELLPCISDLPTVIKQKRGKSEKCTYFNVPAAFDIETSSWYHNGEKRACMYIWQLGINGHCIVGRTWKELKDTLSILKDSIGFDIEKRLIVYVHDLRYEYQFIRKQFKFIDVFEIDDRRPVKALTADGIEFRCSYMLSGKSLEKTAEDLLKYKVKKAVGKLDYEKIRHSETPLTDDEMEYCINDIKVVMSFIQESIEADGDITRVPLTKTSYVRRICKENCFGNGNERKKYSAFMKRLQLTDEVYDMCKKAFQGGYVHCNPYYSNRYLEDVDSYDFASSYPATMVHYDKFPMTTPVYRPTCKTQEDYEKYAHKYCCLAELVFENIRLKSHQEVAPISTSKCDGEYDLKYVDNGRLIKAKVIKTTITEQDYYVYKDFYDWDKMSVNKLYTFEGSYLPTKLVDAILTMYETKTQYKDVEGKEFEYMQAKSNLNSVFGMCVTDIMKQSDSLEDYNSSFTRFLYYPWGVWITAVSRRALFTGINECGEDFVYCDTDSIKTLNGDKHKSYIDKYNKWVSERIEAAMSHHGFSNDRIRPIDKKGRRRPLGVWCYEGRYDEFKAIRAKAYIGCVDGEYELTLSGVNKKKGLEYLQTLGNPVKEFNSHMFFPSEWTGKLCHTYIDEAKKGTVVDYLGNRGKYNEKSFIHMEPTSYDMSVESEFLDFMVFINNNFYKKETL